MSHSFVTERDEMASGVITARQARQASETLDVYMTAGLKAGQIQVKTRAERYRLVETWS
jgi:hypothetical protein